MRRGCGAWTFLVRATLASGASASRLARASTPGARFADEQAKPPHLGSVGGLLPRLLAFNVTKPGRLPARARGPRGVQVLRALRRFHSNVRPGPLHRGPARPEDQHDRRSDALRRRPSQPLGTPSMRAGIKQQPRRDLLGSVPVWAFKLPRRFMRRGSGLSGRARASISASSRDAAAATDEDDAALRSGINQEGDTDVRVYRDDEDARLLFKSVASKSSDDQAE